MLFSQWRVCRHDKIDRSRTTAVAEKTTAARDFGHAIARSRRLHAAITKRPMIGI